ncbi:MAG: glycoside hydrolase family 3 C-terminal domain-containing protein [Candidatus Lokiarchaeota archaeon]|nr:glycoside hydrolase family 3 C-terminal domain-containing protein [Candidatus Lokiarchaeota archaeon]
MDKDNSNEEKPLYLDYNKSFEARVDDLVSRMTLEEKISQMFNTAAEIPRLNIPEYNWWNECLHGILLVGDHATVFPQAIALAATWNVDLINEVANTISDEARAKHHEYVRNNERGLFKGLTFWSPNVNLFRDPRWGRGQETYGEDPFLSSRMAVSFIRGLQGNDPKYLKVVATPKHYVVHSGPEPLRHKFNVHVSEKDLWESYLPAFESSIKEAKAFSIMCAYNRTNNDPCCSSKILLQEILRDNWGFEGYVVSDCGAITDIYRGHKVAKTIGEATALSINAGCDLFCNVMQADIKKKKEFWGWMKDAIEMKLLTEETIDSAIRRLFMARFKLGMFDPPELVQYQHIPFEINDCEEHRKLALKTAKESIVLLKNEGNLLPLKKDLESIAVIGPNADTLSVLRGNYASLPSRWTTFLNGIKNKVSSETEVLYTIGCPRVEKSKDGFNEAIYIAEKSEVVIMALGISPRYEGEEGSATQTEAGGDRPHISLPGFQEELLKAIRKSGKPIVLILTSGSALAVNYAEEHIPAIIQAWYPGEEGGNAVADVIFGDYNPAGKLPITYYKSLDQLPPFDDYRLEGRTYRYFKDEPLYPFGYGLSYTKFKYSNLQISPPKVKIGEDLLINVDVENIGEIPGDEIVQLYLSKSSLDLNLPIRELQGFKKITLKKGEINTISFTLTPKNLFIVNDEGKRIIEPGIVQLSVGGCQPGFGDKGVSFVEESFELVGENMRTQ